MPSPIEIHDSEEAEPLQPPPPYEPSTNVNTSSQISGIIDVSDDSLKKTHIFVVILYGFSLMASIVGLVFTLKGWYIARTAPFDKPNHQREVASYESHFYGMMSVYALFTINILWTSMNIYFAWNRKQVSLAYINHLYDLFIWGTLIAFSVLNIIYALWGRRLCDAWSDNVNYELCDIAQYELLVVEVVACALGMLVAVIQFILLVSRCVSMHGSGSTRKSKWLTGRIREEEDMLRGLIERRTLLENEIELLDRRLSDRERHLPPLPQDELVVEPGERVVSHQEENLIDLNQADRS